MLEQVASHLFMPSNDTPELTAVNESAVAALYERMRHEIDFEIDAETGSSTRWRSMVLAAYEERFGEEEQDFEENEYFAKPSAKSTNREAWSDLIESLEDEILWDRDFMMDEFMDAAPEKSQMLKQHMGIDDDYYSSAAPDIVSDDAADDLVKKLESIAR